MARDVYYAGFAIATPPGITVDNAITTPLNIGEIWVFAIEWLVPPGPRGNLGWYIASQGVQIVPWTSGNYSWIIADDEHDTFTVGQEDNNGLSLVAYNTGIFEHTTYLRVRYLPIAAYLADTSSAPAPLGSAGLGSTYLAGGLLSGAPSPWWGPTGPSGPSGPTGATRPLYVPPPTPHGPAWESERVTLIVPDPPRHVVWLVTTEPPQRWAITDPAAESAYRAAGIRVCNLPQVEIDRYPIAKL